MPKLKLDHPLSDITQATRRDHTLKGVVIALFAAVAVICALGLLVGIHALGLPPRDLSEGYVRDSKTASQFKAVSQSVAQLQQDQVQSGQQVVDATSLEQQLSQIQVQMQSGHRKLARTQIRELQAKVENYHRQLQQRQAAGTATSASTSGAITVPIMMYHQTPGDFDAQLSAISAKGYTAITMDQLSSALAGRGGLPAKPVVITFDDGYASQLTAALILQRHHMPATFYIISGGERSNWCIGMNRRYGDPLQPAGGCGDGYMTPDQIKDLDQSGLITIGGHTVDHENLASDSVASQQLEINQNKLDLERLLGHPIYHFAYPYGSFNAEALSVVRAAGYITAVSTLPGVTHTTDTRYTLHRVREISQLP